MRICREYVIAICVDGESDEGESFWKSIILSNYPESKHKILAKIPPPEREIVLNIRFCQIDELLTSDIRVLSTFGATQHTFFSGSDVRTEFLNVLTGLLTRLVRDNPNLKFYGVNVVLLFLPISDSCIDSDMEENTSKAYTLFQNWCGQITSAIAVTVTFDIVCDKGDLATVLKSEIRRIKHGDMMAQFGGAF